MMKTRHLTQRLGVKIETSEVFGIFEQADGSELERGRKNLR